MRRVSSADVRAAAVASLGLNPEVFDLESPEALGALVRRTASMLCPCPPRLLIDEMSKALRWVASVDAEEIESALEAVVAHGDLLELQERGPISSRGLARLIYLAPPAYVARESGSAMLVGLAPDGAPTFPSHLGEKIEFIGHVRRLAILTDEDKSFLDELGVRELVLSEWSGTPSRRSPEEHLAILDAELEEAPPSGEIPGLRVLDASLPVRFYKGRWAQPGRLSGRFIGRRPQAYGADLWCFVELARGDAVRFLDFPVEGESCRGCDEAWRLQAAIDAVRGASQQYRLRRGPPDEPVVLDLFSPVPGWARRRWDAVGSPVAALKCLFSYQFSSAELDEELRFLHDELWLTASQSPNEIREEGPS